MNIDKILSGLGGLVGQRDLKATLPSDQEKEAATRENAADISQEERQSDYVSVSPIWQELAQEVDVRHATPREIITLSRRLYAAGAISYEDHINLSFQPEISPGAEGETLPFTHEKKDYIAIWQTRQNSVLRFGGNREQIEDNLRIQSILTYLDRLRP